MKKHLLFIIALCAGVFSVSAQDMEQFDQKLIWKDRAKYFNIAYVSQQLSVGDALALTMKNDWGASLSSGKTFYLHRKPIGQMLKFGLDWTWFDINGAGYSTPVYDEYDDYESKLYQAEIGMQFGPSITINPVDHLKISAYCRVTPCYSVVYNPDEESILGSYSTFVNAGASIAWNVISLGVEYRVGNAEYKDLSGAEEDYDEMDFKYKTSGVRFYFGFRF